jgi:hypothetical protein
MMSGVKVMDEERWADKLENSLGVSITRRKDNHGTEDIRDAAYVIQTVVV